MADGLTPPKSPEKTEGISMFHIVLKGNSVGKLDYTGKFEGEAGIKYAKDMGAYVSQELEAAQKATGIEFKSMKISGGTNRNLLPKTLFGGRSDLPAHFLQIEPLKEDGSPEKAIFILSKKAGGDKKDSDGWKDGPAAAVDKMIDAAIKHSGGLSEKQQKQLDDYRQARDMSEGKKEEKTSSLSPEAINKARDAATGLPSMQEAPEKLVGLVSQPVSKNQTFLG